MKPPRTKSISDYGVGRAVGGKNHLHWSSVSERKGGLVELPFWVQAGIMLMNRGEGNCHSTSKIHSSPMNQQEGRKEMGACGKRSMAWTQLNPYKAIFFVFVLNKHRLAPHRILPEFLEGHSIRGPYCESGTPDEFCLCCTTQLRVWWLLGSSPRLRLIMTIFAHLSASFSLALLPPLTLPSHLTLFCVPALPFCFTDSNRVETRKLGEVEGVLLPASSFQPVFTIPVKNIQWQRRKEDMKVANWCKVLHAPIHRLKQPPHLASGLNWPFWF